MTDQPTIEQLQAEIAKLRAKLTRQGSKPRAERCACGQLPLTARSAGRGHTKDRCPNYQPAENVADARQEESSL